MRSWHPIVTITIICLLALLPAAGMTSGTTDEAAPAGDMAIKGYDPVAYFTAGKAMKGSEAYTFRWHDLTWHFQSGANRDLFAAAPEKYAPQYDGYCAWAMTEKRKAVTDPEVWKIVDGRLYLNCSAEAYRKWSRDIPGHIKKADANWLEFQQQQPETGNMTEKAAELKNKAVELTREAASVARETAGEAKKKAAEIAREAVPATREAIGGIKKKAAEVTMGAAAVTENAAAKVKEKAGQIAAEGEPAGGEDTGGTEQTTGGTTEETAGEAAPVSRP